MENGLGKPELRYVWSMEEKAPDNWAVKAGMGTLHYFVMTMPMIEENAKVEDYA